MRAAIKEMTDIDGLLHLVTKTTGLPICNFARITVKSRSPNFVADCTDGRRYVVKLIHRSAGIVRIDHPLVVQDAFPDSVIRFNGWRVFILQWLDGSSKTPESLTHDACRSLLNAHASFCKAAGPGRIHGDFNFKNVLFNHDRVSGILDLESVRPGHPCDDLIRFVLTGADRIPIFRPARRRALIRVFKWMVEESQYPAEAWNAAIDSYEQTRWRRRGGFLKRLSLTLRSVFHLRFKTILTPNCHRVHLGWSSKIYHLEVGDLALLSDYDGNAFPVADLPSDEIILFICPGKADCILRGRERIIAMQNLAGPRSSVPVRIVYRPNIAKWNLPITMIRVFRKQFKYYGTGVYHMSIQTISDMGLERTIRSRDTAYRIGKHRLTDERRNELFDNLCESLRKGFDDSRPLTIMLCRISGMRDSLDNGHHRMSACRECGIDRVAIRFSAAGAIPLEIVHRNSRGCCG